ncbi:unnamed protein product, partial [marine sediment metagenome]
LFSPWHRVEIKKQTPGFTLEKLINKLTFNLISRTIGFLIRAILIGWGILFSLFFFIIGLPIFLLWQLLSPLTWPIFFHQYFRRKNKELVLKSENPAQLIKGKLKNFVYQRLGVKTGEELLKIKPEDIKAVISWYFEIEGIKRKKGRFWRRENLFTWPSFGSDLAFGYTHQLDKYCHDLAYPPPFSHPLIGREKEIKQIVGVLTRSNQANVLLSGEPGVGRHTILFGLAQAIKEKKVEPSLFFKRVLLLDMNLVLGKSG